MARSVDRLVQLDRRPRSATSALPLAVRLAILAFGATMVTAWLGSELVYHVRVALDDDTRLVPYPDADGGGWGFGPTA